MTIHNLCRSLASVALLFAFVQAQDVQTLAPEQTVEREIKSGQMHRYRLALQAGQFVRLSVEQQSFDVALAIVPPGGKQSFERSLFPVGETETLAAEATTTGDYIILVRAFAPTAPPGSYQLSAEVKATSTAKDKQRIAAEQLLDEATQLQRQSAPLFNPALRQNPETQQRINQLQKQVSEKRLAALQLCRESGERAGEAFVLTLLGNTTPKPAERAKAIAYHEQALTAWRELQDQRHEARALTNIGLSWFDVARLNELSNPRTAEELAPKAIPLHEQALTLRRALKDRNGEADSLLRLGEAYSYTPQLEKRFSYFEQALAIYQEQKNLWSQITLHTRLGNALLFDKNPVKAIESFEAARTIQRASGNRFGEFAMLQSLANAYRDAGQLPNALECLEQALAIVRELKIPGAEVSVLNNLAITYNSLGQVEKAIETYDALQAAAKAANLRSFELSAIKARAAIYARRGSFELAIAQSEQGVQLARESKDQSNEASFLDMLGTTYKELGNLEKAISHYEQSIALMQKLNDPGLPGRLINLGEIYGKQQQYEKAIELAEQALAFTQKLPTRNPNKAEFERALLVNLADYHHALKAHEKEFAALNRALAFTREMQHRRGEAQALQALGRANLAHNQGEQALEQFRAALVLNREYVGPSSGYFLWVSLRRVAQALHTLGRHQEAVDYYEQALRLAREWKYRSYEASTLSWLMEVWQDLRQPQLATLYGKQAINLLQDTRRDIRTLDQETQQEFLKAKEGSYRKLADLLIAQGRLLEAEQVIRMLKEDEYFEYLRRDSGNAPKAEKATLSSAEAALEQRYREIADQLSEIGNERRTLLEKNPRTPAEEARLKQLEDDLTVAGQAFQRFLDGLAKEFAKSKNAGRQMAPLRASQGIMGDLRALGKGVVGLYTLVGEEKYRVILTTADFQRAYEYPIKAAELNRKILAFREVLQNPQLDPLPLAQELYQILIAPVAKDLRAAKAQMLMWSFDGVLRYVLVAALHDGEKYLVERFRHAVFTPVSNARLKDEPSRNWRALGLGVTRGFGEKIPALPAVAEEIRSIIREEGNANGILPGTIKLDEQFTQEAMLTGLQQRNPVVHVASHFRFQPGTESDSALLLGDGKFLSLATIRALPSPFGGVELLTLSACNTATSSEANGKEVEGFGALAQQQGAKAVVASLWPVADRSTRTLMQAFYQLREANASTTKAEALQQAQRQLLRGALQVAGAMVVAREIVHETDKTVKVPKFKADPKAPYAHPYYWAPFILIGNWK